MPIPASFLASAFLRKVLEFISLEVGDRSCELKNSGKGVRESLRRSVKQESKREAGAEYKILKWGETARPKLETEQLALPLPPQRSPPLSRRIGYRLQAVN